MRSVFASVQSETIIPNGVTHEGSFKTIWVGVSGDVVISRDKGITLIPYPNVPVGFFNVSGDYIDSSSTAMEMLACTWT